MTTQTEAQMHRRSTALQFGNPMSTSTTLATFVAATVLSVGTLLAFAGTMFVLAEMTAETGALLVAGTVVLAGATVLRRSLVRTVGRLKSRPRRTP